MEASAVQRVLVLAGPKVPASAAGVGGGAGGIVELLRGQCQVVVVETMEAALEALRGGEIDAVISESADFLPLERALASQQSGLILDTIGEGICIADEAGQILWANRRMKSWPAEARGRIQEKCHEAWNVFESGNRGIGESARGPASPEAAGVAAMARSRRFSFSTGEQHFEMFCSPVMDAQRRVSQVVAICWDATSGRRLQQKIDAIDQAGRELVKLEEAAIARLNVGQRLKLLEERVIKYCRLLMQFDHFAIRLLDKASNKLELVIAVGLPTEAVEVELYAEPEGNGISGYVASTGRSYICPDIAKDSRYVIGLAGARSSLTVPLMLHNEVIGIFNIESQQAGGFTEDDRQFAEIFGRYVAVALNILNLLAVERHETTGRLASDVSSEIAAPLNDIVSEATLLMEDYLGDEGMKGRLRAIVENVTKIRRSIKEVAEGPRTLLGKEADKKTDPALEGKRVLVADDEPTIRQTIADILSRLGCVVDQARDGAEACAFLAANPRYDVVLSDIKMPHKDGYEIYSAAQKIGHGPPVILMTAFGYDPSHSIVRASQEGLSAVLFKPFRVEQLLTEVRKAVVVK